MAVGVAKASESDVADLKRLLVRPIARDERARWDKKRTTPKAEETSK